MVENGQWTSRRSINFNTILSSIYYLSICTYTHTLKRTHIQNIQQTFNHTHSKYSFILLYASPYSVICSSIVNRYYTNGLIIENLQHVSLSTKKCNLTKPQPLEIENQFILSIKNTRIHNCRAFLESFFFI